MDQIKQALELMSGLFERTGSKPHDDGFYSGMSYAHAMVNKGLKAVEQKEKSKAWMYAGFAFGRLVGLGMFKKSDCDQVAAYLGM